MIEVTTPTEDGNRVERFAQNYCDILDGWLVIMDKTASGEMVTVAGFAPGTALAFEMVPDED